METPELGSMLKSTESSGSSQSLAQMERSLNSLRALLVVTLVLLVIGSLGVNVLMVQQLGAARRQAEDLEKRLRPVTGQYENTIRPRISAFLNALVGFARTNPDFLPILQKYPIQSSGPVSNAAPVAGVIPAAAPTQAPKK